MTISLLADSYFAMRYNDDSDKIDFNVIELFCRESWTQCSFEQSKVSIVYKIFCASIIFAQLFLNIMGAVNSQGLCTLFLVFTLLRLGGYLGDTLTGFKMAQSNMVGLILAVAGVLFSTQNGMYSTMATMFLCADAMLGAIHFSKMHQNKVEAFLQQ